MMLLVENAPDDIYFNLAAEEHLLKHSSDEFCMLWTGRPCVVVGKHQALYAEINLEYVRNNHVLVARRLTGGGAVYHDPGNLNFTFIRNGQEGALVDFRGHTKIIRDYLSEMGLDTRIEGQHSITLHGLKISGNAEHVYKKRVLHHGTLLFSSELDHLKKTLEIEEGKYVHKGVRSVPGNVGNIDRQLPFPMTLDDFAAGLKGYILDREAGSRTCRLTAEDQISIMSLRDQKYATREWIFGYSPKYAFQNNKPFKNGFIQVQMDVHRGRIQNISLECKSMDPHILRTLEAQCQNALHEPDTIQTLLGETHRLHPGNGLDDPGLLYAFF